MTHIADQTFWGKELEHLGVSGGMIKRAKVNSANLAKSFIRGLNSPDMVQQQLNRSSLATIDLVVIDLVFA